MAANASKSVFFSFTAIAKTKQAKVKNILADAQKYFIIPYLPPRVWRGLHPI